MRWGSGCGLMYVLSSQCSGSCVVAKSTKDLSVVEVSEWMCM